MRRLLVNRARLVQWILLLMVVPVFLWQAALEGDFRVDDAYITFAFSKNLAAGHGPVYGYGMVVEGYSNFLWMLLSAIAQLLYPADILLGVRIAAWGCVAILIGSMTGLVRLQAPIWAAVVAAAALALCSDITRAVLSGLETVPFTAAIAFAFYFYLSATPSKRRYSALAFVPAALLRIDGFLPLLFVLGFEILTRIAERRFKPKALLLWAAPALAVVGAYWLWRWHYYGLPLPTTYYAKTVVAESNQFRGSNYLFDSIRDLGLLPVLILAVYGAAKYKTKATVALAGFCLAHSLYVVQVGGDWMPFNRFVLPILPLLLVLMVWGLAAIKSDLRHRSFVVKVPSALAALAAVGYFVVSADAHSVNSPQEDSKLRTAEGVEVHTRRLLEAAPYVHDMIRKPGEKLVTDYGGVFAYYSEAMVFEMWGLSNRRIALEGDTQGINPIYGKTCVPCYKDFDPDYFHSIVPLLRPAGSINSHSQMIRDVFQGAAIDRVIDLRSRYAIGFVEDPQTGKGLYFLEKRRAGIPLVPRSTDGGRRIVYPQQYGH